MCQGQLFLTSSPKVLGPILPPAGCRALLGDLASLSLGKALGPTPTADFSALGPVAG